MRVLSWIMLLLMAFSIVGCEFSNSDSETKDNSETSTNTEELTDSEEPARIIDKAAYEGIDNTKMEWWFRRDKNHGKSGCQEEYDIGQYDAYYVDKTCGDEKRIYITFDCGYENGYTLDILDVLKEKNVKAAFFVTQTYIRDNVDIVKRMKEEGHIVGNHTVTHPSMPSKSIDELINEIETTADFMKDATGYDMDMYLRPPRGEYSQKTLLLTRDMGYKTIFWSMAYLDYDVNNQPGCGYVVEHFKKYHHPGAIALMHNVSVSNKDALPQIIDNLKEEGYTFCGLNELK